MSTFLNHCSKLNIDGINRHMFGFRLCYRGLCFSFQFIHAGASSVGVFWPSGWTDQDATWYGGWPRPRRHCARWGPSSPPPKRGQSTPTSAHIMSVVAKRMDGSRRHLVQRYVGLGSGHIELDGDPAPPQKGAQQPPPIFDMSLVAKPLDGSRCYLVRR